MKKYLTIVALFVFVFAAASTSYGQIKTGGYKTVSPESEAVVAAGNFAVETRADNTEAGIEMVAIHKAEQQVVQGMNYRMCLQVNVADGSTDEPFEQFANVVVYRTLKNEYSLKSWSIVESCD